MNNVTYSRLDNRLDTGACIPEGEKNFGAEFFGVSCKCTPEGESAPLGAEESHLLGGGDCCV